MRSIDSAILNLNAQSFLDEHVGVWRETFFEKGMQARLFHNLEVFGDDFHEVIEGFKSRGVLVLEDSPVWAEFIPSEFRDSRGHAYFLPRWLAGRGNLRRESYRPFRIRDVVIGLETRSLAFLVNDPPPFERVPPRIKCF